jgi:hypothetical protein
MVLTGIGFSLYAWYARAKDYLIIDIRNMLEDCRALNSWDDRSELKLSPWGLRRIRSDMWRYYQIHAEMHDGVPYGTYQDRLKEKHS